MLASYILLMLFIISTLGKECDNLMCSNIFDEVCGIAELEDGTQIKSIFKNYCYMKKAECEEKIFVEIYQVENELCGLTQKRIIPDGYQDGGRRVNDFSIVGAYQACNHVCPTFCTDIYEPACAQIWLRNMVSFTSKLMINHCHIDLFSCTAGVNVTIQGLGYCFKNSMGLLFMKNVAAMKSLKLLDLDPTQEKRRKRNVDLLDETSEISLKNDSTVVVNSSSSSTIQKNISSQIRTG